MFVKERFILNSATIYQINDMVPEFGYNGFGELVFYRTYSRTKPDGYKETWNEVVIRVIQGIFSIRKDWYVKNHIEWDTAFWQVYARHMAVSMFKMEWLPPGRGLWAMGTDYIYQRGSMALQNCGFTVLGENFDEDLAWLMDALMCGVGVGFTPERDDDLWLRVNTPSHEHIWIVEDTREDWVNSTKALINSYLTNGPKWVFDYHLVRGPGLPIKGFGGISSGPEPLIKLHERIRELFKLFTEQTDWYDSVLLKTDLANAIGCAVVSGNVRRSAQLACGDINDPTFINLKEYSKYPHRADIGWMSNNSVILERDEDFEKLGEIAKRVIKNGEPGYINLINMAKGRIGHEDGLKIDKAIGFNPCGEQPLEDKELCCLVETLPTRSGSVQQWIKACEYATVYASTVTLLPTHQPVTNKVMNRNRRIGVGIIDVSGWKHQIGVHKLIKNLRDGYAKVRATNQWVNSEAGIPEAIRVTTIKPGGTVPKVAGRTSGIGHPNFTYTLRRVRIARNSTLCPLLDEAGVPSEPDVNEPEITLVYSFPILQGPAKPSDQVSLWEQAMNLILMQREWSDNAVSNTLNFKPAWIYYRDLKPGERACYTPVITKIIDDKIYNFNPNHEEDDIEAVLSTIAPFTKSVSLLPHSAKGVYQQMPEEGLTEEEYTNLLAIIKPIDWSKLKDDNAEPEKYCEGEKCLLLR